MSEKVVIGKGSFIGLGASIIEFKQIDDYSIIGAGAVVIEDIPDHVTAVGMPARIIKR